MSIYKKLQEARIRLQSTELKKSGANKFAGYSYFELGDFLPAIQTIFNEIGLCGIVSFNSEIAELWIHETDGEEKIVFTSPMADASLKGCHPIQNLGAVQTYQRRYLWMAALEIVEHDALDSSMPLPEDKQPEKKPESKLKLKPNSAILDFTASLESASNPIELYEIWEKIPANIKQQLISTKDKMKAQLTEATK